MKDRSTKEASRQIVHVGGGQGLPIAEMALSLEPRFMFDAAGLATGAEVQADAIAEAQAEAALEAAESKPEQTTALDSGVGDRLLTALADTQTTSKTGEIVFVDTSVSNYETLLAGIDPGAEVVLLDSDRDGVEQIAEVLEGRSDISAVHIISHGDAGQLQLGSTVLTQDTMEGEYADELAVISSALGESADILIYGCNFAEGDFGQRAADTLAELTGADVAASTDLSGHASLGADWDLEHQTGDIETGSLINEMAQSEWRHLLMDTDGDTIDDSVDVDDDNDGVLDTDEGVGIEVTTITTTNIDLADGPANTNTDIDLSGTGLSIGDTVTVSNVLADGDLNGAGETFSLDFNSGEQVASGLATGEQFVGAVPLTAPINFNVTVIDIGGGTPGINVDANSPAAVDDWAALGYGVRFTFDITFTVPTTADTDGDGIEDHLDIDSDNDGITDNVEAQATEAYILPSGTGSSITDANSDGLDDNYDAGVIGGGSPNGVGLTPVDSDGDGTADLIDADADDDGVDDIAERGDGQPTSLTFPTDTDGDGLVDIFEGGTISDADVNDENLIGTTFNLADSDDDLAADGSDAIGSIQNLDFRENNALDVDEDGLTNSVDADADNDGILNTDEGATGPSVVVTTTSNIDLADGPANTNTDIDLSDTGLSIGDTVNISNVLADGDLDGVGETFTLDFNSGERVTLALATGEQFTGPVALLSPINFDVTVIDIGGGTPGINVDANSLAGVDDFGAGYGVRFTFDITYTVESTLDWDADGIADHLDIDSDNDGITDTVEAQATADYILPSGVGLGITDANGDGLDDNFDAGVIGGGSPNGVGFTPLDTDSDGVPDFRDGDGDGDGVDDIVERGDGAPTSLTSTTDTDGDGLVDIFEGANVDDQDVNDENLTGATFNLADSDDDTAPDGSDAVPPITDLDYREDQSLDVDNDGIVNVTDADADNDGVLDTDEGYASPGSTTSGDIDLLDGPDTNTVTIDLSTTGLEVGDTVTISNVQADGDLDAAAETFTLDFNSGQQVTGDLQTGQQYLGLAPVTTTVNLTVNVVSIGGGTPGIFVTAASTADVDQLGGNPYAVRINFDIDYEIDTDTDGDGLPDHLDIDSDNDGITDTVEAQATADYILPSGVGPGITDANSDGLDDNFDAGVIGGGSPNGVGLTPVDTDSDTTADIIDADSDDDGVDDIGERGDGQPASLTDTTDTDGDGLVDIFEGSTIVDADVNDDNLTGTIFNLSDTDDDTAADGSDASPPAIDLDYRDDLTDVDSDGLDNSVDVDADNDGILNVDEGSASVVPGSVNSGNIELEDGPDTATLNIDLSTTGLSIGDTVTVSNVMANGDLDGDLSVEFFRLDFNSGEHVTGNLATGEEHLGFAPLQDPIEVQVTVIDIGAGTPGISVLASSPAGVNDLGQGYGVLLNFDVSWTYPDFDADGFPDWLDIDSDNDGITDNVEAQTTQDYIAPSGIGTGITDINGDGLDDNYDAGVIGGGPPNGVGLTPVDTDNDGTTDVFDDDSDNDGIGDIAERGDGQPRSLFSDTDADSDGLLDIFEGSNVIDIDANDENLTGTTFNLADSDNDTAADGSDAVPLTQDLDYRDVADTDNDGVFNANDIDADNDGILNVNEGLTAVPGSITTGNIDLADGPANTNVDIDLSGTGLAIGDTVIISNVLADGDLDSDTGTETFTLDFNSGEQVTGALQTGEEFEGPAPLTTPITLEVTVIDIGGGTPGINVDANSFADVDDLFAFGYGVRFTFDITWTAPDTDGDGVSDYLDLDSDNDGLSDLFESGASAATIAADTNLDGLVSVAESAAAVGGAGDNDGDGLMDLFDADTTDTSTASSIGTVTIDNDSDGVDDVLDLDSDDDGIADTIEFRPTAGYQANDGDVRDDDADGDGVIDIFDANDGTTQDFGGSFSVTASDVEGDGTPDYLDSNSDDDLAAGDDSTESGFTFSGTDNDLNGIDDNATIGVSYTDPDGTVTTPSADLPNQFGGTSEIAFRERLLSAVADVITGGEVNESVGATLTTNALTNDILDTAGSEVISIVSVDSATSVSTPVPGSGSVQITTDLGGLITVHSDGTLEYDPNGQAVFTSLNFGDDPVVDSFNYTISFGGLATSTSTVNISVGPDNEYELSSLASEAGADGTAFNGVTANDQAGFRVESIGDINGDGYDDFAIGAITSSPHGNYSGETYVIFGKAGNFGATFELSSLAGGGGTDGFVLRGVEAGDLSGRSISGGDVNGDGFSDLILSASRADPNGSASGEVYVVFGRSDFTSILGSNPGVDDGVFELSALATGDGSDGFVMYGIEGDDNAGRTVAFAGDVDGDGLGDILVSAHPANPNGAYSGETYLIYGKTDFSPLLTAGVFELSSLAGGTGTDGTVFNGVAAGDESGYFVAGAGDFNGDGLQDIAIGAHFAGSYAGAAYVVYGQAAGFGAGQFELSTLNGTNGFALTGSASEYSGTAVMFAGDMNGDGFDDLVVSAPYASPNGQTDSGTSYIIFGQGTALAATQALSSTADVTINGALAAYSASGQSLAFGDINGDGFDDLIVGRGAYPGIDAGAAYVLFGSSSLSGTIELSTLVPVSASTAGGTATLTVTDGFVLSGVDSDDYAGQAVSAAGDVNGDGFDDLIIGAYTAAPNGTYSGEAYIIYGKDFRDDAPILGTTGTDVLNGAAADEVLIGADGDDTLDGAAGNDVLIGGNGDDTLVYDASDIQRVDGGGGNDTLALTGSSGVLLDLTGIGDNLYRDIEVIDLSGSGDNTLRLSTLDLLALSGSSNVLTVEGNAGDAVQLSDFGSWTFQGLIGGYNVYTNGEATIRVLNGIPVSAAVGGEIELPVNQDELMMVADTAPGEQLPPIHNDVPGHEATEGVLPFTQQLSAARDLFGERASKLLNALTGV